MSRAQSNTIQAKKDAAKAKLKAEAKVRMSKLRHSHEQMLIKATRRGPDFEPTGPLIGPRVNERTAARA